MSAHHPENRPAVYMLYVYSHDRKSFRLSGSHNGFPPLLGSDLVASDPLNGEEELGHPRLLATAPVQRHHSKLHLKQKGVPLWGFLIF